MSTLAKLKKKAAEFEQKRQFDKALALYVQVLDGGDGEEEVDVALYNRVGDLLLREGKSTDALVYYEKAIDLYAGGGFFNNAIALCNKILRHAPGRSTIYYKLGKISALKGFKSDAKQSFLEYADRMRRAGELDEAFRALREFADLCPDQEDVRLMLAEQLSRTDRKGEALEQLQLLYDKFDAEGRRAELRATVDRMRAIDPNAKPDPSLTPTRSLTSDLVFLDVAWDGSAASAADVPTADPLAPRAESEREPIPLAHAMPASSPPDESGGFELSPAELSPAELEIAGCDEGGAETSLGAFVRHEAHAGTDGLGVERTVEGEPLDGLETWDVDPAAAHVGPAFFAERVDDSLALSAPETAGDLPLHDLSLASDPPLLPPLDFAGEPAMEPLAFARDDAFDDAKEPPIAAATSETAGDAAVDPLAGLVLIDDEPALRATAPSVDELRARVDVEPEQWGVRRHLARALLERGEREAGVRELELAMTGYERADDFDAARAVAEEIIRVDPSAVRHHQKLVEYAFRTGDRGLLCEAYLELADALLRVGQAEKARTVYDRVVELAPDDVRARAALAALPRPAGASLAPRPATPTPRRQATITPPASVEVVASVASGGDADFVNLGDWLRDGDAPRSTRMVVDEKAPTGDEQADFAEMLREFKAGVAENVDEDDHESHYDLGIAFKEMGLLDEAIAAFQKALRATGRRVRTYEALGQCFMEKGQRSVASTILSRALGEPGVGDEELVGVLYLLGHLSEAQRNWTDAVGYYQRVFAVDIQFRDVASRLAALEQVAR